MTETARIEIHSFETVTLTNTQFLVGAKKGTPARVGGALRLPKGNERVPAVILVHGSAGIGANADRWAREFNKIGVAAFLLDCFTGRGIVQTIIDQAQLGHLAMIVDSYRALELLSMHARIDASRIAIMGFSKGGFAALYASLKRFQRMHAPAHLEFAAYLAFYAPCNTVFMDDEEVSDRPIRLFHGAQDNYVSVEPCRRYVARLRSRGKDIQLTEYKGAQHVFDNPLYFPVIVLPDAVVTNRCSLEERPGGEIFNLVTGRRFNPNDSCVSRGATLGYHASATAHATRAVKAFLTTTFKLTVGSSRIGS
jgi:dienelactone hydrolase